MNIHALLAKNFTEYTRAPLVQCQRITEACWRRGHMGSPEQARRGSSSVKFYTPSGNIKITFN
jgi:hypothetical protein